MKRKVKAWYYGRCSRCNHKFGYSRSGLHACKWGGCNGEVMAVESLTGDGE